MGGLVFYHCRLIRIDSLLCLLCPAQRRILVQFCGRVLASASSFIDFTALLVSTACPPTFTDLLPMVARITR